MVATPSPRDRVKEAIGSGARTLSAIAEKSGVTKALASQEVSALKHNGEVVATAQGLELRAGERMPVTSIDPVAYEASQVLAKAARPLPVARELKHEVTIPADRRNEAVVIGGMPSGKSQRPGEPIPVATVNPITAPIVQATEPQKPAAPKLAKPADFVATIKKQDRARHDTIDAAIRQGDFETAAEVAAGLHDDKDRRETQRKIQEAAEAADTARAESSAEIGKLVTTHAASNADDLPTKTLALDTAPAIAPQIPERPARAPSVGQVYGVDHVHPALLGLLTSLPPAGSPMPDDRRAALCVALAAVIDYVYAEVAA